MEPLRWLRAAGTWWLAPVATVLVGSVMVYAQVITWLAVHPEFTPRVNHPAAKTAVQDAGPDYLVDLPGISTPRSYPAGQVRVSEDDEVIGITVGAKHRAYLVRALDAITCHVINDLVDRHPVTVTYCNRTDCAKVFKGVVEGVPLAIGIGGWKSYRLGKDAKAIVPPQFHPEKRDRVWAGEDRGRGSLMLMIDGHRYFQDTGRPADPAAGPLPYREVDITRTTWAEWQKAHPGTDIYMGDGPGQDRQDAH
jgi:hypothetical protein